MTAAGETFDRASGAEGAEDVTLSGKRTVVGRASGESPFPVGSTEGASRPPSSGETLRYQDRVTHYAGAMRLQSILCTLPSCFPLGYLRLQSRRDYGLFVCFFRNLQGADTGG